MAQMAKAKHGATARRMGACTAADASHLRKPTCTNGKKKKMYKFSAARASFGIRKRIFVRIPDVCEHRYLSFCPTWRPEKTPSAFLDMHDSSAWLQPARTIQQRTQRRCNPPWLTGKETLATGTTTQFSWGEEVSPLQLGPGRRERDAHRT